MDLHERAVVLERQRAACAGDLLEPVGEEHVDGLSSAVRPEALADLRRELVACVPGGGRGRRRDPLLAAFAALGVADDGDVSRAASVDPWIPSPFHPLPLPGTCGHGAAMTSRSTGSPPCGGRARRLGPCALRPPRRGTD